MHPIIDFFIDGTENSERLKGTDFNDEIRGYEGDDEIYGGKGDDVLYGDEGNDRLYGDVGDDVLYGGAGDDWLYGGAGNDYLSGGAGNDWLVGGEGNDTFVFGRGYGHDFVDANDPNVSKRDVVRLVGLNFRDVEFLTGGHSNGYTDIIIRIKETGETLTIAKGLRNSGLHNNYGVQAVIFADQTLEWAEIERDVVFRVEGTDSDDHLSASRLNSILDGGDGNDDLVGGAGHDHLYGGAGDDKLYGFGGDDVLDGGAGNDHLYGGEGNDTFVFGRGYGHDFVDANDPNVNKRDVVRLAGLNFRDVDFLTGGSRNGYTDIIIRIKDTGETLTIAKGLRNSGLHNNYGVQAVIFADQTLEWAEIERDVVFRVEGTDSDDHLSASRLNSILDGGASNDELAGGAGHDHLYGGAGDDKLYGFGGDDVLDGGAGNDHLYGGEGNDTFVFGRGYGHDFVDANDPNVNKRDVVRLAGLNFRDVDFLTGGSRNGYTDIIIRIKDTGETLTIAKGLRNSGLHNNYGVQVVIFADQTLEWAEIEQDVVFKVEGTDSDDHLSSSRLNSIFDGGAGNDYLSGGAGNDTYLFRPGDGQDTIYNAGGGNDLLKFTHINPAELWFGKLGNHLTIGLVGTTDQVTVSLWFANGDYKVDTIEAGGSYITENQVAQMVQAMATLGAPAGVDGGWNQEQREALTPILASYWQPKI